MSDIRALEGRITAALDRIRQGVEARAVDASPDMTEALAAERATNAELVERVRSLKDRQDKQVAGLSEKVAAQQALMAKLDAELQSLRAANVQLREMNTQLRQAVTTGLAPELLNAAAEAEIEALHTQRAADAAEVDAILAELTPLLKEAENAAG